MGKRVQHLGEVRIWNSLHMRAESLRFAELLGGPVKERSRERKPGAKNQVWEALGTRGGRATEGSMKEWSLALLPNMRLPPCGLLSQGSDSFLSGGVGGSKSSRG